MIRARSHRSDRPAVVLDERGAIFVLTLCILAILTVVITQLAAESRTEIDLAVYDRDHLKALELARSSVQQALALLDQEGRPPLPELLEQWQRLNEEYILTGLSETASLQGTIRDESAKLNVNRLRAPEGQIDAERQQQMSRLFGLLGVEGSAFDSLLDWLDQDDKQRPGGAEKTYYLGRPQPYEPFNGPLATMGQLALIKDMASVELAPGSDLEDFLTIYSDGRVNVNTAGVEVLQSLDETINAELARAIVAYRVEKPFKTVEDLQKVPGMSPETFKRIKKWVSVEGEVFEIAVQSSFRDTLASVHAIVRASEEAPLIAYWRVD